MMRLQGKVAVVTGAASGIGRGIALRFAAEGAALALADVNDAGLQETHALLPDGHGPVLVIRTDVSKRADVETLVSATVQYLGGLDIMVANAGVGYGAPFLEETDEQYDTIMNINMRGVYLCGQVAGRTMAARGTAGCIINMASIFAEVTEPDAAVYSAAKGGVRMLTKSMALELGGRGIRVNSIAPGWIRTGMNPAKKDAENARILARIALGRKGTPDDVAGVALFLASEDAAYVSGSMIFVDGGGILQ